MAAELLCAIHQPNFFPRLSTLAKLFTADMWVDRALPFTVDDIFMTFDDKRTRATLAVLNEMADRFQMIVFTHHDHLAELARAELPRGRIHVHALPEFVPMARSEPAQPEPSRANGQRTCRSCGSSLSYSGRGRPPVQCADCIGG
jgi:hypothetical protein